MLIQLVVVLLLVTIVSYVSSFRPSSLVRLQRASRPVVNSPIFSSKTSDVLPPVGEEQWEIDDDSSEVICESSAEVARKAELARLEAQRAAEEKARREAEAAAAAAAAAAEKAKRDAKAASTTKSVKIEPAESPLKAVVASNTNASKSNAALTDGETSAFDVGLFIAFPVILATLGLFFIFPLIKDQLAVNLPPPMSQ